MPARFFPSLGLRVVGLALLLAGAARAGECPPWFFIQLTDPQFGMAAKNADFAQETANFEFAIATANRLKPAFVIVTGDLLNKPADPAQAAEYLRIVGKLDRAIKLYSVPGNHDLGNDPTPQSIAAYCDKFGPDHYSFRAANVAGIVLNSNLVRSPKAASALAEAQERWFKSELEKARAEKVRHVIVFQHHPWFLKAADEPDEYFNLPLATRRRWLDLLRDHGGTHVFAGHLHNNQLARDGTLEMVTTGAIGQPLAKSKSGMRVVIVRDREIEHRYYELGEIPNRIELSAPAAR